MHYLLILSDQNLRPLRSRLKELGAFYTGLGYAIPAARETEALEFCKAAQLKIHKQPLPNGTTFEAFEQSHKAAFFRDKLIFLEREIQALQIELQTDSPEELQKTARGQLLLEKLEDAQELKEQSRRAEQFEKALSTPVPTMAVKFISELPRNYLLEEAPEIPRLINYKDGSIDRPFLRKGILGMLVGAGGVGKTHALAQLAFSIATGYPWLDTFPIEKPGHVFLGLGENQDSDIHRLLRKITKHFLSKPDNAQLAFFDRDPLQSAMERIAPMAFSGVNAAFIHQSQPTPFFKMLLSSLKEAEPSDGWSCIILDPISRFIGMDAESDNAAATQFIALLEKLSMELKGHPTILFGHHMNKGGVSGLSTDQAAARGSSAITDGVRWQVNLERIKDEIETAKDEVAFRHVKSNFTSLLPKHIFKKDGMGCLSATQDQQTLAKKAEPKKGYVKIGLVGGANARS
ncbi:MAG: AAA family ATPase [Verrucomicrobia bacterium]|nr:AAA family ATPase [Verrucomicrobiota bacterium]